MSDPTIPKIVERLTDDAEGIAARVLPDGERQGGEWYCTGSRSPTGYTISVRLTGPKRGVCGFFGDAGRRGGDLLDLIQTVQGCTKGEAVREAKRLLGMNEGGAVDLEKERQRIKRREKRRRQAMQDAERQREVARGVWEACERVAGGSAAERYLVRRGLPPEMEWPATLGAHHGLSHTEGGRWPCLVGRITGPNGGFRGVQRIYVTSDGHKAPVSVVKKCLGAIKGGAVYLSQPAPVLHVAEGIESALAVLCIQRELLDGPDDAVCATLGASGMAALEIPEWAHRVIVWPDADRPKERGGKIAEGAGQAAGRQLVHRCHEAGIDAQCPPNAWTGRDPLDVWLRMRELANA